MPVTIHKKHENAHDFLKHHPVGVLATVDPNGEPHAAAIYFTIDSDSTISFLTKSGTKKADNLEHNNHAELVVYEAETQTTVQATGMATKIEDSAEMNAIFTKILNASLEASDTSLLPISKLREGEYVVYTLRPKQIRMAVFSRPKSGEYDDLFKTIVPEEK